jgi:hypothetical protein
VAAALELAAEGADELAVGVEDEDRRMIGLVGAAFVDDVHEPVAADGDVVGRLPGVIVRELGPLMVGLVLMAAGANQGALGVGFRGGDDGRGRQHGERPGGGLLHEGAA